MNYYTKTNNNTWKSIVRTCESLNIKLADIIIHTKYPINSERVFGFNVIGEQENINCGLILHNYDCKNIVFDNNKPDIFTNDEWSYLLPKLIENNLIDKQIQLFKRNPEPVFIIEVITKYTKIYFYSNYSVRIVYKIVNDDEPIELSDLFIDNGACLNAIYIRNYCK